MWPDWITGLFEFALRAESDVALRLQIGKKTGPGCISPCDKVIIWYTFYFVLIFFLFLFFFLSNRAPLGFSMNFWYLSHTEKFWRAVTCLRRIYGAVKKLNCGNTFYLCHDQIPSQPSLLCVCLKLFSKRWHKLSHFHKQNVQPGARMGTLLKLLG